MKQRTQNILITGATSGIGEAIALYYAGTTAKNLFICGRNPDRLKIVTSKCEKLGAVTIPQLIDVTDREAMDKWIRQCNQTAKLNLVIANAGVSTVNENIDSIYNTFATNVNGVLNTVLPTIDIYQNQTASANGTGSLDKFIMQKKKQKKAFYVPFWSRIRLGRSGVEFFHENNQSIAIVSSMAGYHGLPTCPAYSASKACVKAWGEALRNKLRSENIKVNVICPGFVRSRITDQNTCPMPMFMEADKAAAIIADGIAKNKGIIAFPWPLRFVDWFVSILPNCISDWIYSRLPNKA